LTPNTVAFIPARSGSKRVVGKNTRLLAGQPLIYWTIKAALESECFSSVVVSSDSMDTLLTAAGMGADGVLCPTTIAHKDNDPDILWVRHALRNVDCDVFSILRPTSPFRTVSMIQQAVTRFQDVQPHSLRAVRSVREHPYKMWRISEGATPSNPTLWMTPFAEPRGEKWVSPDRSGTWAPAHSSPTQTLPAVYVQDASLEIAWRSTIEKYGTISGTRIIPFFTSWPDNVDLNTEEDWSYAEWIIAAGHAHLQAGEHRSPAAVREAAALGRGDHPR
jgi:CMP-N,N'-diacetyllegionaminic acid synthase